MDADADAADADDDADDDDDDDGDGKILRGQSVSKLSYLASEREWVVGVPRGGRRYRVRRRISVD